MFLDYNDRYVRLEQLNFGLLTSLYKQVLTIWFLQSFVYVTHETCFYMKSAKYGWNMSKFIWIFIFYSFTVVCDRYTKVIQKIIFLRTGCILKFLHNTFFPEHFVILFFGLCNQIWLANNINNAVKPSQILIFRHRFFCIFKSV